MVDTKLLKLIQLLYKKALADEVTWETTVQSGVFEASFTAYSITVSEVRNRETSDTDILLSIFNESGELVERTLDTDFAGYREEPSVYAMMSFIYNNARRTALGVDMALDSLLLELES